MPGLEGIKGSHRRKRDYIFIIKEAWAEMFLVEFSSVHAYLEIDNESF